MTLNKGGFMKFFLLLLCSSIVMAQPGSFEGELESIEHITKTAAILSEVDVACETDEKCRSMYFYSCTRIVTSTDNPHYTSIISLMRTELRIRNTLGMSTPDCGDIVRPQCVGSKCI